MDTVDVMNEVDTVTAEQVNEYTKAEKEANLIPVGKFEGLVMTWEKVPEENKSENNQFRDVPLYRAGIRFYDCPEAGKSKSGFFNFTPTKVLGEGGRPKMAYTTLVGMVKSLHMEGQPLSEVFEQAKVTRLKYRVGQFEMPEGDTINFLKGITAA